MSHKSVDKKSILIAIKEGQFYSSSGPEIYEFGIKGNQVYVHCSGVQRINFIGGPYILDAHSVWSNDKTDNLSTTEYTIREVCTYIRVECIDSTGKTAWSNPIFF
ncbi:MAG: hypothetical protein RR444_07565 [Oscillospiraceae bacterium]